MKYLHTLLFGSPQGSPISPLLWNIVISGDLDISLPPGINIQAYADDTAIVVPRESRAAIEPTAAIALERVAAWSFRSKVTISVPKSFFLTFPHGSAAVRGRHLKMRMGDDRLQHKTTIKILGVIFDSRLRFKEHADYLREQLEII